MNYHKLICYVQIEHFIEDNRRKHVIFIHIVIYIKVSTKSFFLGKVQ